MLDKLQDHQQRLWYAQQTIEHGWSRNILAMHIVSDLYSRQALLAKKTNNFELTLPPPQSELAQQIFKDSYKFDFLGSNLAERQLEQGLIDNITTFLLELGTGFAFVGKQYPLATKSRSFAIDLLFYHLKLRSYIIIELKTGRFEPEYAGKMAFYLAQIDKKLKTAQDKDSIGIILCQDTDKEVKDDSMQYITKPIGVSGYQLAQEQELPQELQALTQLKQLVAIPN